MAPAGESPPRGTAATIVALPPIRRVMHYHAWLRSGQMFGMKATRFSDRTVAHRWAARQRANKADRLVLACEECPRPKRSRRRPPAWGRIARDVAAVVGLPVVDVRHALDEARERDAERQREQQRSVGSSRSAAATPSP